MKYLLRYLIRSGRVYRLAAIRHKGYQGSYRKELPWKNDICLNAEICQDLSCHFLLFLPQKFHPQHIMWVVWIQMRLKADEDCFVGYRGK